MTAMKKTFVISLSQFRAPSELITQRLRQAINTTFYGATLRIIFRTSPLIRLEGNDRISSSAMSIFINTFASCCEAEYIRQATRCLAKRIKNHYPNWLMKCVIKLVASSIIAQSTGKLVKNTRERILATAYATNRRVYKLWT